MTEQNFRTFQGGGGHALNRLHRYWRGLEGKDWFRIESYADIYPWWQPWRRYRWEGKSRDILYYLRCRFWSPYNTVTAKTLYPTYTDSDILLMHIMMQVLCDFMEQHKNHPGFWSVADLEKAIGEEQEEQLDYVGREDDNWYRSYLPIAREREAIYHWWTVERPLREAEYERRLVVWADATANDREAAWQAVNALSDAVRDAEDNAWLKRLIDIRTFLWC